MVVTKQRAESPQESPGARDRRELDLEKSILFGENSTDGGRGRALISMGVLAPFTADKAIAAECVDTIGAALTQDTASTTLRQNAAYALGLTKSPQALDYLERVLRAGDEEKSSRYVNTVRANVVRAVGAVWREHKPRKTSTAGCGSCSPMWRSTTDTTPSGLRGECSPDSLESGLVSALNFQLLPPPQLRRIVLALSGLARRAKKTHST